MEKIIKKAKDNPKKTIGSTIISIAAILVALNQILSSGQAIIERIIPAKTQTRYLSTNDKSDYFPSTSKVEKQKPSAGIKKWKLSWRLKSSGKFWDG